MVYILLCGSVLLSDVHGLYTVVWVCTTIGRSWSIYCCVGLYYYRTFMVYILLCGSVLLSDVHGLYTVVWVCTTIGRS